MANCIDYMTWRGDLTFNKIPCLAVDNIIFTDFIYANYENIIPSFPSKDTITVKNAADKLFSIIPAKDMNLGLLVGTSPIKVIEKMRSVTRFSTVKVGNFRKIIDLDKTEQFSACTFVLTGKCIFVAIQGTDDTLVGWQENMNLINTFPVAAQRDAKDYLNKIGDIYPDCEIIVGGHSKGGNLAEYASVYCKESVKERISAVYSNDGPGIIPKLWDMRRYNKIKDKIIKIMPENSIIGMLFSNCSKQYVVKSSMRGFNQHRAISWQIEGNHFETVDHVSDKSTEASRQISELIESLDDNARVGLISDLYMFSKESGITLLADSVNNKLAILKAYHKIKPENKKVFGRLFKILLNTKVMI